MRAIVEKFRRALRWMSDSERMLFAIDAVFLATTIAAFILLSVLAVQMAAP